MEWAAAEDIPMGAHVVAVRHDGSASGDGLRTTVSHTAYSAPRPTSGPNGGNWGDDHADSRSPAPPTAPGPPPLPPPGLQLKVQFAGRHTEVTVDGVKNEQTKVVFQQSDNRLPLTEVNVTAALGQTVVIEAR